MAQEKKVDAETRLFCKFNYVPYYGTTTSFLRFNVLGESIELETRVGIFLTLNLEYAERAEFLENLKFFFSKYKF